MKILAVMAAALVAGTMVGSAQAETINFDTGTVTETTVSNGYGGFNWNNLYAITVADANNSFGTNNGYTHGVVSGDTVVFNGYGDPAGFASVDGSTFTLDSLYLTAAWNNGLAVTIQGLRNGVVLDTDVVTVDESGPTLETLNFAGIDQVVLSSDGGTIAPGVDGSGTHFAMDDVIVNATAVTPEPGSLLLLGTGVTGMLGMMTRRRVRA